MNHCICINQSNRGSAKMSDIRKFLQKKWKVNAIVRKESRNKSIDCKTLFVSVWDAVMKLTAVGKYHFSSGIRNFKNIKLPPPPLPHFLCCIQFLRTSACVCRTSENCKSLVLQGKCKIEIFLSPVSEQYLDCLDKMSEVNFSPAETLE